MKTRRIALAAAAALVLASCGGAATQDNSDRDDSGEIVDGGDLGVFAVQEGDCINLPDASDVGVASFEAVACDVAHDAQVYNLFDLTDAEVFPGDAAISAEAEEGCFDAFEPFIGLAWEESQYFFTFVPPSETTWDDIDDREVICIVVPATGEPQLTMSLEGVAS